MGCIFAFCQGRDVPNVGRNVQRNPQPLAPRRHVGTTLPRNPYRPWLSGGATLRFGSHGARKGSISPTVSPAPSCRRCRPSCGTSVIIDRALTEASGWEATHQLCVSVQQLTRKSHVCTDRVSTVRFCSEIVSTSRSPREAHLGPTLSRKPPDQQRHGFNGQKVTELERPNSDDDR